MTRFRPVQTFYPSPQMAASATVVYRKLGLKILRQSWINFDLIWAVALLAVGLAALWLAVASAAR